MAVNIYTHTQVQVALQRGLVALLLISQKIQSDFLFLYNQQYITYKDLQYDVYSLYNAVNNEQDYVRYTSPANTYELNFYGLVGALIKFTKTVDVFGKYDGSLNPNIQSPGTTIITVPVLQNLNNDQLPINTTNDNPQFILANYQSNYAQLYGDNPIVLQPYINAGGFNTGDEQTPPIITRVDPDDPNSPILSILFDYPVATLGYLDITGFGTISSGSPSSGGGVIPITFSYTQDDLIYDGVLDQWYLPLVLPGAKKPFYASLNGDSIPINYSATTGRFNGFANNDTCTIQISLM